MVGVEPVGAPTLTNSLRQGALVTDVGSVKATLAETLSNRSFVVLFVSALAVEGSDFAI